MRLSNGFEKCQRCGDKSSGRILYQCKRCRQFFCESCKLDTEECPHCGLDHYTLFASNWQKVGTVK